MERAWHFRDRRTEPSNQRTLQRGAAVEDGLSELEVSSTCWNEQKGEPDPGLTREVGYRVVLEASMAALGEHEVGHLCSAGVSFRADVVCDSD